ncbi:MAG: 3-methyl-2-oxobutanoate hydroxymethyltransferase [Candidatus Omnitrophica bacterium]|nr:3-methyl-2-oxobutanoate hydroxymethyltransferase [Candidatus Omnitrophota bacterium]
MKITVRDIIEKKKKGEKITALTAYDYAFAGVLDQAGLDIILVGDSVGTTVLGYDSTVPVTMRDMLHHTKAVARAVKNSLLVADMPFGSYENSTERALRGARRLLKEGGAQAIKVEGAGGIVEIVKAMTASGVPVMGHLGLTPQTAEQLGGYKVQGKLRNEAEKIWQDARHLEGAGIFSLVLECVPYQLAKFITGRLKVPTIGIGAGPYCDGQILVLNDLLGLEKRLRPKFVRRYADLGRETERAVASFKKDVLKGSYPSLKESFAMDENELPGEA